MVMQRHMMGLSLIILSRLDVQERKKSPGLDPAILDRGERLSCGARQINGELGRFLGRWPVLCLLMLCSHHTVKFAIVV